LNEFQVEIMWNLNHFESAGDVFLKEIVMLFEHLSVGFSFTKVWIGFDYEVEDMKENNWQNLWRNICNWVLQI
jgi:hypothetical protein